MLYCDKNYIREGIDIAKSHNIRECIIYQFGFCNHVFSFQVSVCNGFHDFMMLRLDITIIEGWRFWLLLYYSWHHQIWSNLFVRKLCAWSSWVFLKMHINEINIKTQVCDFYFNNSIEAKKLETKNILVHEKN